jgi:tetratricopeptide (TPR) repeat protein
MMNSTDHRLEARRRERRWRVLAPCLLAASLSAQCGCSSLGRQPLYEARGASAADDESQRFGWIRRRLRMEDVSINDVQGPEERRLRSISRSNALRDSQEAPTGEMANLFAGLKQAEDFYNEGQYAEAERVYTEVRNVATPKRGFRKGLFNQHQFQDDLDQSPIEEDAIFGMAQAQFKQGKLAEAEETYAALLKEYPSTRHLDTVSRQLFRIAREWLGFPDSNDQEIVQVAYGESPPTVEQRRERRNGWAPRFGDKTRPSFDIDGRALGALRLIWLHDAAGPLADDALMMAANYHTRQGDTVAAAQHYRLLQEQFPNSPHFKDSLMLGSHVLLASYNGAGYDPSPLEEAKQLKLLALQYPDLSDEDRGRIEQELDQITEAEIEPLWKEVQFYITKRQPESVVLHCNYIINKFPNSKYARMAAEVRGEITGEKGLPNGWPYVSQPAVAQEEPVEPAGPSASAEAQDVTGSAEGENEPREPRRFLPRFMRPVDQPPELQPVETNESGSAQVEDQPAEATDSGRVRLQSPSRTYRGW